MRGFTLLEIILSLALVAILSSAGFVFSRTILIDADLDKAATGFAESARRADMLSRGVDGDSTWGVHAQPGSITLFKGGSYVTRDTSVDETIDLPLTITPSGTTEFVFSKLSGFPAASGTLTLTGFQGQSRSITINGKGTLSY